MMDAIQLFLLTCVPLLLLAWLISRKETSSGKPTSESRGNTPKILKTGYSWWTGHVGYIIKNKNRGVEQFRFNLHDLAREAPEPVMAIYALGPRWLTKPVYSINDPQLIATATTSSKTGRFASLQPASSSVLGRKSLTALQGGELRSHRKLLTASLLSRPALSRFVNVMTDVTTTYFGTLPNSKSTAGTPAPFALDLIKSNDIGAMLVDAFANFGFGVNLSAGETNATDIGHRKRFLDSLDYLLTAFAERIAKVGPLDFLSYLDMCKNYKLRCTHNFIRNEVILPAVRRRRADRYEGVEVPPDTLDMMLELTEDGTEAFTEEEICDEAVLVLTAGYETTAYSIMWALHQLALHPECQQRCYEEVCSVMSSHPPGTTPCMADLDHMTYLHAVLQESGRLTPIAHSMHREVVEDLNIGGYFIPKGSDIMNFYYGNSTSEDVYTKADKFMPERWLNDPTGGAKKPGVTTMPFGNGPQRCFGQRLAVQAMRTIVALWVQRYRFEMLTEDVKPVFRISYIMSEFALRMFPRSL
eukprot:scpid69082/ scgid11372/ Cytochrome P450 3A4; Albendazole monooxygenase; Albendazole sulfoxidase; CYPIIIA3; CYPIIIA4; Cytochrome P450 3A3; Cytochrome P450 HLp; Cytochrome P450 NF-25; Cytochrome P450-PCN1; Nifedipine oxidase; Quinine 3-monooxygenase; Taurochenodeoxycholate 6-alpha-hydroxylase